MTEEKREAAEILLAGRLYVYTLLHKVFGREPDGELLALLTAGVTGEALGLFSLQEGDTLSKAAAFLTEVQEDREAPGFLEAVREEYMHLFVGPAKLIAPPWESIYFGDDELLFQESTLKVRNTYRAFGLLPEGYPRVPDDSLALELDFMAQLAQRSLDALRGGDAAALRRSLEASDRFLAEHLLVWVPRFATRVAASPSALLYPQMSQILDNFLQADDKSLKELLSEA